MTKTPAASSLPVVAITLGDPGGIGPEIVAKAVCREQVRRMCRPLIIGDSVLVRDIDRSLQLPLDYDAVSDVDSALPCGIVGVLEPPDSPRTTFVQGRACAANGEAAYRWIVAAAQLALAGRVSAVCTAPISKEAMVAAGHAFPGHTELLAELAGGADVRMMLEGGGLRVVLETIHVALAEVPARLSTQRIQQSLAMAREWGRRHLGTDPRIAVCGLNPHAGEAGRFGREEIEIIAPAVAAARAAGARVAGPLPADTVFHRQRQGEFHIVLAMYHDQGLIPVKTLDFHGGVNITLGLPFVRTSPDHGTAFDIAGRGIADDSSMAAAIVRAATLAQVSAVGR
ncbi:MAG: 4-hydroxythreonine-4-phosphate dehydrogenase PdxA [Candidatus Sumerlaeaceae bacterium]|nr:4-hydroxythreonine-4-phosphate dehydrogenase PdxA [Candidatus Sumerlaeaceae bacterium]